jgi:DUF1680 family protein
MENLDRISFSADQIAAMTAEYQPELLGGVTVLHGQATLISEDDWNDATLYRYNRTSGTKPISVKAIPYSVWDNREAGEMRVWFRCD